MMANQQPVASSSSATSIHNGIHKASCATKRMTLTHNPWNQPGNLFNLKLFMFFMKKALTDDVGFAMDLSINGIQKIDNLLFLYEDKDHSRVVVVQVIHKCDSNMKIKPTALTSENVDRGDFCLRKHFDTFNKINDSDALKAYDSKTFIILTNGSFEINSNVRNETFEWSKYCILKKLTASNGYLEFLNINREAQSCKFTDNFRKNIFNPLLKEDKQTDGSIEEFFNNFTIITNFPNENELDLLIGDELVKKCNIFRNKIMCNFLERKIFAVFQKNVKEILYSKTRQNQLYKEFENSIDSLLGFGLSMPYVHELRSLKVEFAPTDAFRKLKEDYLRYLLYPGSGVLHVRTDCAVLSAIKILQSFNILNELSYEQKINGYLFMDIQTVENEYDLIKNAFLSNQNNHVLVIVAEKESSIEVMKVALSLLPSLNVAEVSLWKKIILISQRLDIDTDLEIIDKNLGFNDFTGKSQTNILKKEILFQGNSMPLNQLLDESLAREILDVENLLKLIKNEKFEIGRPNTFSNFSYVEDFYMERELHRSYDDEILSENSLVLSNQKIVLIVDDSCQGKSTLLTSLSKKIHNQFNQWIIRLNLNELPQKDGTTLDGIDFTENDTINAMEFLSKFAVSKGVTTMEQIIFEHSKIALFVDSFDEISNEHQNQTIILLKALCKNPYLTLWVTSSVGQCDKLEHALETRAFHLIPLSKEDKIEFLNKFLQWNYSHCIFKDAVLEKCNEKKSEYLMQLHHAIQKPKCHSKNENSKFSRKSIEKDFNIEALNIREYAESTLRKRRNSLKDAEVEDFELKFLHLRMLAEVTVVKAFELPSNFGEFNLYSAFIDNRLEHLIEQISSYDIENKQYEHFKQNALRTILSEKAFDIFCSTTKCQKSEDLRKMLTVIGNEKNLETMVDHIGLLNKDQSVFVHHSFAEYFASKYLFENLKIEKIGEMILKRIRDIKHSRTFKFFVNHIEQNYTICAEEIPLNRVILVEMYVLPKIRSDIYQFRSIYTAYEWYIDTYFFHHNNTTDLRCTRMNELLENIAVKMFSPTEFTDLLPLPELDNDDCDTIFEYLFECGILTETIGFVDRSIAEYFLCRYLCKYFKSPDVQSFIVQYILSDENFVLVRRLFHECLLLFTSQFRGIIEWIIIHDKEYTKDLIIPGNTRKLIDAIEKHSDEGRYLPKLFKMFRNIYYEIDEEVTLALFNRVADPECPLSVYIRVFDNIEHLYMVKKSEQFDDWKARCFKNHSEFTIMSLALSRKPLQASSRDVVYLTKNCPLISK